MSGITFGKDLKRMRKQVGISSKVLSQKVGKAVTYVSQLERGLIKNPDYNTCYNLLKELGIQEGKIEDILYNHYNIASTEREEAILEQQIKQFEHKCAEEEADPEEYAEKQLHFWLEETSFELRHSNDNLHHMFNVLIDKDITRAETVIKNIESLTKSKETFDFFCALFEHDYSAITNDKREHLLHVINELMRDIKKGGK